MDPLRATLLDELHARCTPALDNDARRQRFRDDREIRSRHRRLQECRGGAAPLTTLDRVLIRADPLLLGTVEVVGDRISSLAARLDERVEQHVGLRRIGDAQGT